MPLSLALQERLKKRGLIKSETDSLNAKKKTNEEDDEEIIAESYDEPGVENSNNVLNDIDKIFDKLPNCPNLTNPHHACTEFCIKKFGYKKFEPNPIMEKRRIRMLKIYPLPSNWIEIPDIHTNRYYYWNTETNQVSWMSPTCPKAKLEFSKKSNTEVEKSASIKSMNEKLDEFVDDLDNLVNSYQRNNPSKAKQTNNKKSKQLGNLDPMDPSSYSDVPRGKWSDGLDGS